MHLGRLRRQGRQRGRQSEAVRQPPEQHERKRLHDKFMEIHKSQQHSNNYWHFAARKIMEEPDAA